MVLAAAESADELGRQLMWFRGDEERILDRPIIRSLIHRISRQRASEAILRNPLFRLVEGGKDARRKLATCSVEYPDFIRQARCCRFYH